MEKLTIVNVTQTEDKIEIYLCFEDSQGEYESYTLSIKEYKGDTKAQFADSLEHLVKLLRESLSQD